MKAKRVLGSQWRRISGAPAWLLALLVIPTRQPSVEIRGFHFIESKQSQKSMEIRASEARVYKPEDLMELIEPLTLLWGKDKAPFRVNGKLGILNSVTRDLEVRGSSELLSPDEVLFKTETLRYDPASNDFLSDDAVEARRLRQSSDAAFRLTGQGLRIDLDRSLYEIRSKVRATQRTSPTSTLVVNSRRSEITPELRQALFYGNVSVKSKGLDLKGDELTIHFRETRASKLVLVGRGSQPRIHAELDKLKLESGGLDVVLADKGEVDRSEARGAVRASFEDGTKLVSEKLTSTREKGESVILLDGDVNIVTGDRVATSEFARFYPDSGEILLLRLANVTKGDQVIEGEKIRFSTKDSEVRVERARGKVSKQDLGIKN